MKLLRAAERLLAAIDMMSDGETHGPFYLGWENAEGEMCGVEMDMAVKAMRKAVKAERRNHRSPAAGGEGE